MIKVKKLELECVRPADLSAESAFEKENPVKGRRDTKPKRKAQNRLGMKLASEHARFTSQYA